MDVKTTAVVIRNETAQENESGINEDTKAHSGNTHGYGETFEADEEERVMLDQD
ncbi:hypothetical protein MMC18_001920 [Xylographa bjoerkii]|nr:hypothetical protein [Xylographa bjoerkii]